jgi:hypothetical protein
MRKQAVFILALAALIYGCSEDGTGSGGTENRNGQGDSHPGIKELRASLSAIGSGEEESPTSIALASSIVIPDDWSAVNGEVAAAKKYVVLDMSACDVPGNKIPDDTGGHDHYNDPTPTDGDMAVIHDNVYIKGLVLPSAITEIGDNAFFGCRHLRSVVIPDGVTEIGAGAFAYAHINEVAFPASVTRIGEHVFMGFPLTKIVFGSDDTVFESNSFVSDLSGIYQTNGAGVYIYNFPGGPWRYESEGN